MPTFRKKPVEIQAERVADLVHAAANDWKALPDWARKAYDLGNVLFLPDAVEVRTLEGTMRGDRADWIIQGVQGELYPCKPDIFTATYDPVAA
jgi:peroxiredoxin